MPYDVSSFGFGWINVSDEVLVTISFVYSLPRRQSFGSSHTWIEIACEQALRARKGRRACNYLYNLYSASNFPVAPVDRVVRFPPISANVSKHWKTRVKGNDDITNVISANQHFASTFWCRYSNSRDVVTSFPSFSRPAARAPRRACSQASIETTLYRKDRTPVIMPMPEREIWGRRATLHDL